MKLKSAYQVTKLLEIVQAPWEVKAIQRVTRHHWQVQLLYTPTGYLTVFRDGMSPDDLLKQAYVRLQQDTGVVVVHSPSLAHP